MIDYTLARKLKNAGFPQGRIGEIRSDTEFTKAYYAKNGIIIVYVSPKQKIKSDWVKIITLSELIEACGESFNELRKQKNYWNATSYEEDPTKSSIVRGNTPEEAVANLWLKLNESSF